MASTRTLSITGPAVEGAEEILTPEALAFVAKLHQELCGTS